LGPAVVRQLDEICKGIFVKDQRELLAIARPVRDRGRDIEEDLKSNLGMSA
jgi:hypothetical protein